MPVPWFAFLIPFEVTGVQTLALSLCQTYPIWKLMWRPSCAFVRFEPSYSIQFSPKFCRRDGHGRSSFCECGGHLFFIQSCTTETGSHLCSWKFLQKGPKFRLSANISGHQGQSERWEGSSLQVAAGCRTVCGLWLLVSWFCALVIPSIISSSLSDFLNSSGCKSWRHSVDESGTSHAHTCTPKQIVRSLRSLRWMDPGGCFAAVKEPLHGSVDSILGAIIRKSILVEGAPTVAQTCPKLSISFNLHNLIQFSYRSIRVLLYAILAYTDYTLATTSNQSSFFKCAFHPWRSIPRCEGRSNCRFDSVVYHLHTHATY